MGLIHTVHVYRLGFIHTVYNTRHPVYALYHLWYIWLFVVDGCFTLFGGDQVEDTPEEKDPYFGCIDDDAPDTCPQLNGVDPIHNFMDYSDDACLTGES